MRQLNDIQHTDKRTKELTDAGLSPANVAWMVPYLDTAQPERPELLEQAEKQDPTALSGEQRLNLALLMDRLLAPGKEVQGRAVKAFFAVLGTRMMHESITQARLWMRLENRLSILSSPLEKLLGPENALALRASCWTGKSEDAERLLREPPEALEAAIASCPGDGQARAILACLWLAKKGGKSKGLLESLLGGKDKDRDRMVRLVQERIAQLLPEEAHWLNPAQCSSLELYLRRGEDKPLPVPLASGSSSRTYLPAAIGSTCFLALDAAPELRPAYRVCAALQPYMTLYLSLMLAGPERFEAEAPWLQKSTSLPLILPYLSGVPEYQPMACRMARQWPAMFEQAYQDADENQARLIMQTIRAVNEDWATQLLMKDRGPSQQNVVKGISRDLPGDNAKFVHYLQTGEGLADLLGRYPLGGNRSWGYHGATDSYVRTYGADPFAVRCLIVAAMTRVPYHTTSLWRNSYENTPDYSTSLLLDLAREQGLSSEECLRLVDVVDQGGWGAKEKLQQETSAWIAAQGPELLHWAAEKGPASIRCAAAQVLAEQRDMDGLLALTADSSKQVRAAAVSILTEDGSSWSAQAAEKLLISKKAAQREAALEIVSKLGAEPFRPALEAALAKEKSGKLAGAMRSLLGLAPVEGEAPAPLQGDPVVLALKGGKKRKIQWALDGVPASGLEEDRLAAVMVSCQAGETAQAKFLARPLDAKALAACAGSVFELWMDQGAPSKQKWVLTFASLFGGRDMVGTLKRQISQWPLQARGAIACDAVYALALSPEPEALLTVDSMSRKFKFKQVKAAAGRALDFAAKELGLTAEELADRIVPDLGLDGRGQRVFDYGPRSFTVSLSPALELEVRTAEGKKLKTLPAPGKQDDPALAETASAEFKALKKQIKATVTTQGLRLEQALSVGRTWTGAAWRALFVEKPVMRQFAVGLVWGVYEGDALTATFRYLEDGSLNTADEEEYTLPDEARVGLVHPVELDAEALGAWKQQLEDYEIAQPIPQLARPVARLDPELAAETALETFGGRVLNGLSLSGKLLSQGWFRGSVQDGGVFSDYYREDGPIGAQLNFSGAGIGGEDCEVTVYDVQFYKAGTVKRGSYVYDAPKDDRLVPLGQVPPRLYSEIVYQLQKATASSTETQEDWRSER